MPRHTHTAHHPSSRSLVRCRSAVAALSLPPHGRVRRSFPPCRFVKHRVGIGSRKIRVNIGVWYRHVLRSAYRAHLTSHDKRPSHIRASKRRNADSSHHVATVYGRTERRMHDREEPRRRRASSRRRRTQNHAGRSNVAIEIKKKIDRDLKIACEFKITAFM